MHCLRDCVRFCVQRKHLLQLRASALGASALGASVPAVAAGVVTVVATSSVGGRGRGNCSNRDDKKNW